MEILRTESKLDPWTAPYIKIKEALMKKATVEVPLRDFWRPRYLAKLLEQRLALYHSADDIGVKRVQELIDSLCIS